MEGGWELYAYVTEGGKNPFSKWLFSLKDNKGRELILLRLERLGLGNFGDCRFIQDGMLELRIHFGPGYRVYFGQLQNKLILLLGGGDKSTQTKDVLKALAYWNEYRRTNHGKQSKFPQ